MDGVLEIVRAVHCATLALMFGGAFFVAAFAPPALSFDLARRFRGGFVTATILALSSGIAWPAVLAAKFNHDPLAALDPAALKGILFETDFGHVWTAHLALLALAAVMVFASMRIFAAVAGLAPASLALTGHALLGGGAGHVASAAMHLLCAGFWLGGLPPFILCLTKFGRVSRGPPPPPSLAEESAAPVNVTQDRQSQRDAAIAMRRFSMFGHGAGAVGDNAGFDFRRLGPPMRSGRIPIQPGNPV